MDSFTNEGQMLENAPILVLILDRSVTDLSESVRFRSSESTDTDLTLIRHSAPSFVLSNAFSPIFPAWQPADDVITNGINNTTCVWCVRHSSGLKRLLHKGMTSAAVPPPPPHAWRMSNRIDRMCLKRRPSEQIVRLIRPTVSIACIKWSLTCVMSNVWI